MRGRGLTCRKLVIFFLTNEEALAEAFLLGRESIISFRQLFFPSTNEASPSWFHHEWDKILREGKQHFAIEAFRESAKTQLVIRGHTLYRLVYPSAEYDFIVIVKANQKEASGKLKEIANEYLSNPVLCANLVKVREQSEKVFEVDVKDEKGQIVNVRIQAFGKGSSIRGLSYGSRRPSLLVVDDPQDISDSQSDAIQDSDYEWFLSDVYFLGRDCRIFLIGNNLGEKALIERVIAGKEQLGFEVMRVPILNAEGKSNWEEYWATDKIMEEKQRWQDLGMINIWYREKMCIAMSPESQLFNKSQFRYYDPDKFSKDGMSVYTTVDMAISEKMSADYSVVMTVAVNRENHWFILDCNYGRWNPSQLMDAIFDAVLKYRPVYVGVEKVAYQAALEHFLLKEMPQRNIFFVIKPLIADKKKELRIQQLQPRFVTGTVWFPERSKFLSELEGQLLSFPKGIHDDLPDALAYIEQIALPPVGGWEQITEIPYAGAL